MPADCPTCIILRFALDDERAITSGAIEAAAIGEAVIAALNGEAVSDFMSSLPPVQLAVALRAERDAIEPTIRAALVNDAVTVYPERDPETGDLRIDVLGQSVGDPDPVRAVCAALIAAVGVAEETQARLDAIAGPVEGMDVEEVLRLDAAATPGPWYASRDQEPVRVVAGVDGVPAYRLPGQTWIAGHEAGGRSVALIEANAAIIATYRTAAPALAREVVALRAINAQQRANAEGTNRVLRDQEDEIARLRATLAAAEQERDAANASLTAIVEAYQGITGNQTTAEQLPADIAALAENEGRLAAVCDMYREFMGDLLVAIGADPTAWDALDEQAKAVEHAKALVRSLEDASAEVERLRAAMLTSDAVKP